MKKDIETKEDIELLIKSFYEKVEKDVMIGYIFTGINWQQHLPVMYNFWENILFYTGNYEGNMIEIHQRVNSRNPLNTEHFKQWYNLFSSTVDQLFEGEKAELAKQRAMSISTIMQLKLLEKNKLQP